jgi:hypothetical protein
MAFGDFTVTRASTKNVLGSAGLYVSVANNVPAFEFNTDGTYRGLLVEPGATNLILQSQDFSTTWGKNDITITDNSIVAPDGATTADTITEGTDGTADLFQTCTIASGSTATFSIFIKANANNDFVRVTVAQSGAFGNRVQTWFNLTNNTFGNTVNVGTATGASVASQAFPNGWYRISLTGAIPSVTSYRMTINSASASGSNTRVNDSVYYLWQAQLETGSVATSPIVTTAGTASRVEDVITLTSAEAIVGSNTGLSLFVEFEPINTADAGLFRVGRSTTSTNDRFGFSIVSGLLRGGSRADATQSTQSLGAVTAGNVYKALIRHDGVNFYRHLDGATVGGASTYYPPVDNIYDSFFTRGVFTGSGFSTRSGHSYIRSMAVFSTNLNDSQSNQLTAL